MTEEPVICWVSKRFYILIKANSSVRANECTFGPMNVLSDPLSLSFWCVPGLLFTSTLRYRCLYLSLFLPPSLTFTVFLSLSPWPVWSVIEGAVFTWPKGMEGTLCALWRQIALLAPPNLYLSFISPLLLLLLSSYSVHPLTTLLASPLYHQSQLSSHPILTVILNNSIFFCSPSTGLKHLRSYSFLNIWVHVCVISDNKVKSDVYDERGNTDLWSLKLNSYQGWHFFTCCKSSHLSSSQKSYVMLLCNVTLERLHDLLFIKFVRQTACWSTRQASMSSPKTVLEDWLSKTVEV